jgi:hypothetical protein
MSDETLKPAPSTSWRELVQSDAEFIRGAVAYAALAQKKRQPTKVRASLSWLKTRGD